MLDRGEVPRPPSPFAAAVLSFVFPGLGQLYAGRSARALAFAAPGLLGLALLAGIVANHATRRELLFSVFSPTVLQLLLLLDGVVLVYRLVAVVDAYALARAAGRAGPWSDGTRGARRRGWLGSLSTAGVAATILVLILGHVALARYDRIGYDTITGITGGLPAAQAGGVTGSPVPPSAAASATAAVPPASATAPASSAAPATAIPAASPAPWTGTGRLNILLLGLDESNTDTMIVMSIDPATRQIAMFSISYDTIDVPLPPSWPAASALAGGVYPYRVNGLWAWAAAHPNLFPGPASSAGPTALMGALGQMLGLNIDYYVTVDFAGFQQVINTLGGVTVNVQVPVEDYHYPTNTSQGAIKLYIPATIQHMDGAQALAYARSRHQTSDFDRAARQQRVILSVRQQTNLATFLDPTRLDQLSAELRSAVHTNFPGDQLPALASLATQVNVHHLHSYVFAPPYYATQCAPAACLTYYWLKPNVPAIQAAVQQAFSTAPSLLAERQALGAEGATVWVLNGSGTSGKASAVASYLADLGMNAQVPPIDGGRAPGGVQADTTVIFYNGAETRMPETVRVLRALFHVPITTATDPSMQANVVVTTGTTTPTPSAPPG